MALIATFEKQPTEVLDYDVDYAAWIPDSDSITSATATVTPPGELDIVTLVTQQNTRVKLWATGGVDGTTYKVEVTITTDDGRVKQDEVRFRCKEY